MGVIKGLLLFFGRDRAREFLPTLAGKQIDVRLGLLTAHPRPEPAEKVEGLETRVIQPVPTRRNLLFHREWNPQVGRLADRGAKELRWSDTDNCVNRRS